jgi:hypothetical protein
LLGGSSASAGQFKRTVYYPAGTLPYKVIAADFNHDGNSDLAIAGDNQIVVLLGNGDGSFQKPRISTLSGAFALVSGDFNEDGNVDLAVTQSGGTGNGAVTILLGDGKGGFRHGGTRMIGVGGSSIATADFNGDGHLDVAVADKGFDKPGDVTVLFGTGKGTLKKGIKYGISGGPFGVATADLNGDHHPDLAVALDLNGSVAILLNDGTGKFGKPVTYNAGGGGAVDVKIADLRHDGRQDLVAANASQGMVVLLNNGDGTFGKPTVYLPCAKFCQTAEAVAVADFNLDGILDVAVAAHIGDGSLYYGKGDGTFKPAVRIHDSIGNFQDSGPSIAAGDFNHDQAPDLAIPITNRGKVAILINTQ